MSQFLCRKYPDKFKKFESAKVFVCRTMQRFKNATEDADVDPVDSMQDKRSSGAERAKPVTMNPAVQAVVERVCEQHNGNIKQALLAIETERLKGSRSSLRKVALRLGFGWEKAWHTDVLTTAQKYKRTLFCKRLLRMSKENLIRLISVWMFTDEKWFDIVGPAPGQWTRAPTKAGRKMQNQVSFCFTSCISYTVHDIYQHSP